MKATSYTSEQLAHTIAELVGEIAADKPRLVSPAAWESLESHGALGLHQVPLNSPFFGGEFDMSPPIDMEKPLISRKALAERWEVTTDSLKRYEKIGLLSPVKITPRMLRYRLSEVVARESAGGLAGV